MRDGVLACRLLNSTNLTNEQKQLIKATFSKNYERPIKTGLYQYFN